MNLTKTQKIAKIQELKNSLASLEGVFVLSNNNMSVSQVSKLRRLASSHQGRILVIKNTLAMLAAKDSATPLDKFLTNSSVLYMSDNILESAKILSKKNQVTLNFGVKGLSVKDNSFCNAGIYNEAFVKNLAFAPTKTEALNAFAATLTMALGALVDRLKTLSSHTTKETK